MSIRNASEAHQMQAPHAVRRLPVSLLSLLLLYVTLHTKYTYLW
jgi:hypothetical protein